MIITKDAVVVIDYAIKDTEGTLLEDSDDGPMSFIQGTGVLVPGLEQALEGKQAGERLQATLTPEEAFGIRDEELVLEVGMDDFQDPEEVVVGLNFQAEINNEIRFCTVESIKGDTVVIDANHPFADKTLNFDITVKDVREATQEELDHGHVHGEHGHHH